MKVFKENEQFNTSGSGLSGYINATYKQLSTILGEPTFSTPSGDNKTQKEWVVKFEGNLFTIYDWKTYDVEYTMNELDRFNIGSKVNSEKFIKILEKLLEEGC
jgi:hypothetical protein